MYLLKHAAVTLVLMLCLSVVFPQAALSGQDVIIDSDKSWNVYGNSNPPDYTCQPGTVCINTPIEPYGNSLTVNSGNIAGSAYGGYGSSANENEVIINGGNISLSVFGGRAHGVSGPPTANNNIVIVNSGTVTSSINGSEILFFGTGDATANYNIVNIKNGIVNGARVAGTEITHFGTGSTTANYNTVNISGGTVYNYYGYTFGGYSYSAQGDASANHNTVNISGGIVGGANSFGIYGGVGSSGNGIGIATGNIVNISGGTVNEDVYGGASYNTSASDIAIAAGNTVNISGGTITGDIYGSEAYNYTTGGGAAAIDNTVTISGSPNLKGIYGGTAYGQGDEFTGNTLNLKTSALTVAGLGNFQYLNFYLPTTFAANDTMLTVTGTADITNSKVNVGIDGLRSPLRQGDQITLIDAGTLTGADSVNSTADGQGMQGVTLRYEFDILADPDNADKLLARVTKAAVNEQAKALSEGYLAGMALVNQGADMLAGQGMNSAVRAGTSAKSGFAGFGTLSGGWSRYHTGSHVDMSSLSLLTGLSFGADLAPGHLTLGAFFEYGNGSYDTRNSFSTSASVHGDGDVYYLGGGLLGRMDFVNTGPGRFYAEASGRAGGVHNEHSSSDLRDTFGRNAEYDTSSAYYGLHVGTGYVWNINDFASLDLYGKYFWTRQEGESARLSTGDPVKFEDADSSRLRLGGRFAYAANEYLSPYVGAAYEHEFDGEAMASANGYSINAPSLRGDTGIGELGLSLKPSATLPLTFDLGVQGYTGKREGVTGSLQMKFEF